VTVAVLLLLLIGTGRRFAAIRITADSQNRAVVEHALSIDPGNYRLRLLLARNGPCRSRIEHARAALRLLPHHAAARRALAACGSAGV
jgi:hypothetical protein